MVDAFEARLQFSKTLSRLTAAQSTLKSACLFLLKHSAYSEDLYSVVLEKLQSEPNPNYKVNLIYFLEMLCEMAIANASGANPVTGLKAPGPPRGGKREGMQYVEYVKRDIIELADFAAPVENGGFVNIEAVRNVMKGLREKGVIDEECWKQVDEMLQDRNMEEQKNDEESASKRRKFDDRMIEQRMNEDRQRHKREKEHAWQVAPPTSDGYDEEFEWLWENTSDLNEDDYEIMREENDILRQSTME